MYSLSSYTCEAKIIKSINTCTLLKPDTDAQKISLALEITGVGLCAILGTLVLTHGWGIHSISQIGTLGPTAGILFLSVPVGAVGLDILAGSIIKLAKKPKNVERKPPKKEEPNTTDNAPSNNPVSVPKMEEIPMPSTSGDDPVEEVQEKKLIEEKEKLIEEERKKELKQQLEQKKIFHEEMLKSNSQKRDAAKILKTKLVEMEKEMRSLFFEIKTSEKQIIHFKEEINSHQETLHNLDQKIQNNEELKKSEKKRLEDLIKANQTKLESEMETLTDLEKKLKSLKENYEKELKTLNQLDQEIKELNQKEYHEKLDILEFEKLVSS